MKTYTIRRVRKAVIPMAGLGTRLFPVTRFLPKAFIPILDATGSVIPLVQFLLEEAVQSGIEHVGLVVNPQQRELFEKFFFDDLPYALEHDFPRGDSVDRYILRMRHLCGHIELITQVEPRGFGDAVYRSARWVGGEPFLLMLGDHLFQSHTTELCAQQLLKNYKNKTKSIVAISSLPIEESHKRGVAKVLPVERRAREYHVVKIMEKPSTQKAREQMLSPCIPDNQVFGFFGLYIFTPQIFEILEEDRTAEKRIEGEFQLTHAMERLRSKSGFLAYEVDGVSMDIGNPDDYRKAFAFLYNSNNELVQNQN
ncbi:hypothetical protein JW979_10455 [bacterium]|nr:hypothetical protein [candidate division CSSED10-310 bacterium]